jgi:hypothetical protein
MPDAEPAAGSASERSDTTTGALLPGVARASRHFRRLARLEAALIVMVVAFSAAIAGTVLWLDRYVETHDRQIAEVNALASELVAMREDARNLQERALEREDRRLRRSDLLDGAGVLAAARRLESEATQALPAIAGRPETLAYRQALDGVSTAIAADLAAGGRTPALDSEVSRALDLVFARFERWLGMVLEAAGVRRDALRAQVSDVTRAVAGGVVALAWTGAAGSASPRRRAARSWAAPATTPSGWTSWRPPTPTTARRSRACSPTTPRRAACRASRSAPGSAPRGGGATPRSASATRARTPTWGASS